MFMVILVANFLSDAVFYNPIGAMVKDVEKESVKAEKTAAGFMPGWRKEIHEKNLFNRDRGYVPPPPPPAPEEAEAEDAPEPPPKPELYLKGVILRQDGEAAIVETASGAKYILRVGDVIEDAELVSIKDKDVTFMWMGEEINLSMERIKTLQR